MAQIRTRKNRDNPHYGFLVSWEPKRDEKQYVKGETSFMKIKSSASDKHIKKADYLAQAENLSSAKKRIARSLILISLILILELVIYLAWNKFVIR